MLGFKSLLAVWSWAGHLIFVCLSFISLNSGELRGTSPWQSQLSYLSEMQREHLPEWQVEIQVPSFFGCLALFVLMLQKGGTEKPLLTYFKEFTYSKELTYSMEHYLLLGTYLL